ncbi:MAG: ABC transporter ATP-binding protein [Desulfarculaceae bacterium]|jgi:ABC-type polysaccharide/polyol phosphate transport system ATPase subunit
MSKETAIEVFGLSKRFRREILRRDHTTWKTLLLKPFSRSRNRDLITVLEDIEFSVPKGTTLAVIGQNGSGKSTLLKILAGIYKPDQGSVNVKGRIASLIELGAGFHPEFTGRENVFLNGTILGLSKQEISKRFDQIVTYSGLGDYIDAPVRTYSSGMYVRLGFSVAVNVDPEVLLVDEVLAVGDEAFAHKCEDKINEFCRSGKTICMVTHDMGAVDKFANEVIWLDGGCIAARGEPRRVIDAYRQKVAQVEDAIRRGECAPQPEDEKQVQRWGDGEVRIEAVRTLDGSNQERAVFMHGDPMVIEMNYQVHRPTQDLVFGIGIVNAQDVLCYGTNSHIERVKVDRLPPSGCVRMLLEKVDLVQGTYFLDVAAHAKDGRAYDYIKKAASFTVRSPISDEGVFRPAHTWEFPSA